MSDLQRRDRCPKSAPWNFIGNPELQALGLALLDGSWAIQVASEMRIGDFAYPAIYRVLLLVAALAQPGHVADLSEIAAVMASKGLAHSIRSAGYMLARATDEEFETRGPIDFDQIVFAIRGIAAGTRR